MVLSLSLANNKDFNCKLFSIASTAVYVQTTNELFTVSCRNVLARVSFPQLPVAFDAIESVRKGFSLNVGTGGVFDDKVNMPNVRALIREYCLRLEDDDDDVSILEVRLGEGFGACNGVDAAVDRSTIHSIITLLHCVTTACMLCSSHFFRAS